MCRRGEALSMDMKTRDTVNSVGSLGDMRRDKLEK